MSERQTPVLMAVFENMAQAQQVWQQFRQAGFGQDYLGIAEPGKDQAGLAKNLTEIGVPEEEARYYEREYDAGRPVLTVRTEGLQPDSVQKAIAILQKNNAYDADKRTPDGTFGLKPNAPLEEKSPYFDINTKHP